MQKLPLDPDVADDAPTTPIVTGYDEQHLITYLRLLHAAVDGADWKEVSRIVLHLDPHREPDRGAAPGKPIWPVLAGWLSTAIAICFVAEHRTDRALKDAPRR
jgi:hypothetical protein